MMKYNAMTLLRPIVKFLGPSRPLDKLFAEPGHVLIYEMVLDRSLRTQTHERLSVVFRMDCCTNLALPSKHRDNQKSFSAEIVVQGTCFDK